MMSQDELEEFISEGEEMTDEMDVMLGSVLDEMVSSNLTNKHRERLLIILDRFEASFQRMKRIIEPRKSNAPS